MVGRCPCCQFLILRSRLWGSIFFSLFIYLSTLGVENLGQRRNSSCSRIYGSGARPEGACECASARDSETERRSGSCGEDSNSKRRTRSIDGLLSQRRSGTSDTSSRRFTPTQTKPQTGSTAPAAALEKAGWQQTEKADRRIGGSNAVGTQQKECQRCSV